MDSSNYIRFMLALVFVLGLILALTWVARRSGLTTTTKGRQKRRLALVEVMSLDAKRRLVLVSRDGREHLLLIGGTSDLVVEADIVGPSRFSDEPSLSPSRDEPTLSGSRPLSGSRNEPTLNRSRSHLTGRDEGENR